MDDLNYILNVVSKHRVSHIETGQYKISFFAPEESQIMIRDLNSGKSAGLTPSKEEIEQFDPLFHSASPWEVPEPDSPEPQPS